MNVGDIVEFTPRLRAELFLHEKTGVVVKNVPNSIRPIHVQIDNEILCFEESELLPVNTKIVNEEL